MRTIDISTINFYNIWKSIIFIGIILTSTYLFYSAYGEEMKDNKIIILPSPDTTGKVPLETAILERRSVRSFSDRELTIEQIAQLLWAAQGITDKKGYRAVPSAGALYPLELYVVKKDGLFQYIPAGHRLNKLSGKDLRPQLQSAALHQSSIGRAPVSIVISAVYERVTSKYGKRGVRYTDIEAGHAAQNIHLEAVALGLASVPIGAFDDLSVAKVLSLPTDEIPLYIIPVGYKR